MIISAMFDLNDAVQQDKLSTTLGDGIEQTYEDEMLADAWLNDGSINENAGQIDYGINAPEIANFHNSKREVLARCAKRQKRELDC